MMHSYYQFPKITPSERLVEGLTRTIRRKTKSFNPETNRFEYDEVNVIYPEEPGGKFQAKTMIYHNLASMYGGSWNTIFGELPLFHMRELLRYLERCWRTGFTTHHEMSMYKVAARMKGVTTYDKG